MISSTLMFAIVVGVLVAGSVVALFLAFAKGDSSRAADRLDVLVGRAGRKDSSADMLLKQALQEVDKKNVLDRLTPEFLNLSKVIEQADANVKPSALVGVGLVVGFLGAVVTGWMVNIYVAPVFGLTGLTAPFIWLYWRRKSRLNSFAAQLPDAMELVARALRAGHSLAAGMHVVAEEMPLPISKEFGRVYEEQNLG